MKVFNSLQSVSHIMPVNGHQIFESNKNMHRQILIKPCGSWLYIDVLRHETIGLCEKRNSIYIIFYLWSTAMSNCPELVHTTAAAFLLYGGSQSYKCITATYLSNGTMTHYLQSQLGVSVVHLRDRWQKCTYKSAIHHIARRRRLSCVWAQGQLDIAVDQR